MEPLQLSAPDDTDTVPLLNTGGIMSVDNDKGLSYRNLSDNNINKSDIDINNDGNSNTDSIEQFTHVIKNKLGTINGCYVPCLLNIMGIILFERLGWGIGQIGVSGVLLSMHHKFIINNKNRIFAFK